MMMTPHDLQQLRESARKASALLKALSNEYRLLILCNLTEGEKSVGHLQTLVDLSQSALSQHLARLRQDGLVKTRRKSQTIYYSLAGQEASRVIAVLYELYCAPERLESIEEVGAVDAITEAKSDRI